MKKLATASLTVLLFSTSALAGGGHDGAVTTGNYNDKKANYSDNMTDLGKSSYAYLGGELGWMNTDSSGGFNSAGNFWSVAPIAGIRIGENLGFETGYTWASAKNDSAGNGDITSYSFDALGYLPINDSKTVEIVGLVGVGRYKYDSIAPGNDSDTALRYGGGLQYEINKNWSTRALYRRAEAKTNALDGIDTLTLGLSYNFR